MDPITLNKLLTIADALVEQASGAATPLSSFQAIISEHSKAKNPRRRAKDALRVLEDLEWVTVLGPQFMLTAAFHSFIAAWNEGDLLGIGHALSKYGPYSDFLLQLRTVGAIPLAGGEREATKEFVALDTFRFWAVACGSAYLSPFDESLHWGGNWDYSSPSLEVVLSSMRDSYRVVAKTGGFADVGSIADSVCRSLQIAFQVFETKVNDLLKTGHVPFFLSPATIRTPSRRFRIKTIRRRSEVCIERQRSQLLGGKQAVIANRWFDLRYLEDGIKVNGQQMKLLRWEPSSDNKI